MIRRLGLFMTVVVGMSLPFGGGQVATAEEVHTTQEGDTVAFIAEEHGVSVDALAAANGLDPASELYAGQSLTIPDGSALSAQIYVVEAGDTIASIATMFDVSIDDLLASNDVADMQDLRVGVELMIPTSATAGTAADTSSSAAMLDGVFAYQQARSLSCEYAAVYIATSVFGNPIYEEEYIGSISPSGNPHYGFRGNIDGPWGITDDYGIYAEALVPLLEQRGYIGEVSYDPRAEVLQGQLDMGNPMIVWIATSGDTEFYETDETGTYKLVPYEHVVVAYGYDGGGVYISDPGNASLTYYNWDWFLPAWSVMDGMALSVHPA